MEYFTRKMKRMLVAALQLVIMCLILLYVAFSVRREGNAARSESRATVQKRGVERVHARCGCRPRRLANIRKRFSPRSVSAKPKSSAPDNVRASACVDQPRADLRWNGGPTMARSARDCHPCPRYNLLPMSPGRTRTRVAHPTGFEPVTSAFGAINSSLSETCDGLRYSAIKH